MKKLLEENLSIWLRQRRVLDVVVPKYLVVDAPNIDPSLQHFR